MKEKSFSKQAKLEIPKETFKIIHKSEPQWWNHFIAGAYYLNSIKLSILNLISSIIFRVGGSVAAICTCPLEVLKTRQQVHISHSFFFFLNLWNNSIYF